MIWAKWSTSGPLFAAKPPVSVGIEKFIGTHSSTFTTGNERLCQTGWSLLGFHWGLLGTTVTPIQAVYIETLDSHSLNGQVVLQ
jgi:hypothetical protein